MLKHGPERADELISHGERMAVRLKDIARDLNVSVITVSKAMRGNTDISESTRERVLKRMKAWLRASRSLLD
jgi:transcriptional regulator with XRE-family HTH domain